MPAPCCWPPTASAPTTTWSREHLPAIAGAVYHGSDGSRGDALRIGERSARATGYLDAYQGHAALADPGATLAGWATVMHGGVPRRRGRTALRRRDDRLLRVRRARCSASADGEAWVVLDERIHEACLAFQDFRDTVESGAVRRADTVEELAGRAGVDADGLAATLAETARCAGRRRGRTGSAGPHWEAPLAPPYEAIQVRPALFHTQGGLLVDAPRARPRPRRPTDPRPVRLRRRGRGHLRARRRRLPGRQRPAARAFGLALLAAEHVASDEHADLARRGGRRARAQVVAGPEPAGVVVVGGAVGRRAAPWPVYVAATTSAQYVVSAGAWRRTRPRAQRPARAAVAGNGRAVEAGDRLEDGVLHLGGDRRRRAGAARRAARSGRSTGRPPPAGRAAARRGGGCRSTRRAGPCRARRATSAAAGRRAPRPCRRG